LILIFIASFKGRDVGTDTLEYYRNFVSVESYKQDSIFNGSQKGWYYFNYILNKTSNYTFFLILCYTIAYVGVFRLIKESKDKALSLIIFFLFFFPPSLNVMRQYIAIGLFCVGLVYLLKNNGKKFACILIFASLFHYTTVLMLPLLFIDKLKLKRNIVLISVLSSFYLGFFSNVSALLVNFFSFVSNLHGGANLYLEKFGGERNLITNGLINIVFVLSFLLAKNKESMFVKLWFLYIVLNNLLGAAGQGNRIFTYLLIGIIMAVPEILSSVNNKLFRFAYLCFFITFAVSYWYITITSGSGHVTPYYFRIVF
jgi:hypothetical protein